MHVCAHLDCHSFSVLYCLFFQKARACMGNLLSLGAKMCIWNLTEGQSGNCDFKCNLGTYFCGVWIVFM